MTKELDQTYRNATDC